MASKGNLLRPANILSDKYWIGRQRGYLEGSGGQLRHMVPSFTEISTGMYNWGLDLRFYPYIFLFLLLKQTEERVLATEVLKLTSRSSEDEDSAPDSGESASHSFYL